MKHNQSIQLFIFVLFFAIVQCLFTACHHSPFSKAYLTIDQVVDDINKEYIELHGIGYIQSARVYKYYSQDKIVDIHVKNTEISDTELNMGIKLDLFNERQERAIELFQFILQGLDEKHRVLFDSISSFKYSARFNIQSKNDTAIAIVNLPPSKIKEALSKECFTDKDEFAIHFYCKFSNMLTPYMLDDNTTCDSVYVDQNNIVFKYQVNDKNTPFDKIDKQQLRAKTINLYKEGINLSEKLIRSLYYTNRGIRYYFHGKVSGDNIVIQLSENDVKELYYNRI